ncbi:MAG: DUF1894 domain-containing protein [Methanobacterium sp.]|jgi:hypothetical protein|nr:DUF1894 domain-containing protein [Methanobacterium sp.]
MSFCLETYLQESENYEILISRAGFKDCKIIIEEHSPEVIHVKAGEKILGVRIIGIPPIAIGIDEEKGTITLPYTKPCYGTSVVELPIDEEEIKIIKSLNIKN